MWFAKWSNSLHNMQMRPLNLENYDMAGLPRVLLWGWATELTFQQLTTGIFNFTLGCPCDSRLKAQPIFCYVVAGRQKRTEPERACYVPVPCVSGRAWCPDGGNFKWSGSHFKASLTSIYFIFHLSEILPFTLINIFFLMWEESRQVFGLLRFLWLLTSFLPPSRPFPLFTGPQWLSFFVVTVNKLAEQNHT